MASFNYRGVDFEVVDTLAGPGPKMASKWSMEGASLNITYRTAWEDRFTARNVLLGSVVAATFPPNFLYLQREAPHAYIEGEGWLYAKEVSIDPEATRPPTGVYVNAECATLRVDYTSYRFNLLTDAEIVGAGGYPDEATLKRYVRIPPPKPKDRVYAAKGGVWKWVDRTTRIRVAAGPPAVFEIGPAPVVDGTFIPYTETEQSITWMWVPVKNIPWSAIAACKNCCNDNPPASATPLFFVWPDQTVIFKDHSWEEITLPGGIPGVNITYLFAHKPNGANYFPDPDRGFSFHGIIAADGSTRRPYQKAIFENLFRPEGSAG